MRKVEKEKKKKGKYRKIGDEMRGIGKENEESGRRERKEGK